MTRKTLFRFLSLSLLWLGVIMLLYRPYFGPGIPQTHDGENHLARFGNYKLALKQGQFPPRFAPNLLNGFGYPAFNYNYPLANLSSIPFSAFKVEYENTFKVLVIWSIIGGVVGVYAWLSILGLSHSALLFGSVAFLATPYTVNAVLTRGNIGEVMALHFLPWLFYFVEVFRSKQKVTKWSRFSLITTQASFLLSHNIAVLLSLPALAIYAAWRLPRDRKVWQSWLEHWILSLGLTLWFWIPALAEKSEIVLDQTDLSKTFFDHFPTVKQLLLSPQGFGFSYSGSLDSLSFMIGWIQLLGLVLGIAYCIHLYRHQQLKSWMTALTVLGSLFFLLQLSFSAPIWRALHIAQFVQFPWRLSLLLSVMIIPLLATIYETSSKSWRWLWIGLLITQVIVLARTPVLGYNDKTNLEYENFSQSTSTANENLPKSFTYSEVSSWLPQPSFLSGSGEISVNEWHGTARKYQVKVSTPALIVEPTVKFLGWKTFVKAENAAQQSQVQYLDNDDVKGRIAYTLEPGTYTVTSQFTQDTWPRKLGNSIFVVSVAVTAWYVLKAKHIAEL